MEDLPRMLYLFGGVTQLQDGNYTTAIANTPEELGALEKDGWQRDPAKAKAKADAEEAAAKAKADKTAK